MIVARKHHRGVATTVALVCLGLVGVTLAGLITRVGSEARRTERENARAQRDQITIAKSFGSVELPLELQSTFHF